MPVQRFPVLWLSLLVLVGCQNENSADKSVARKETQATPRASQDQAEFLTPTSANWTSEIQQTPAKVSTESSPNAPTAALLATFSGPSNGFAAAELLDTNGNVALAVKQTNIVKLRNIFSGDETGSLAIEPGVVFSILSNPDNSIIAIGMNNKTVELWDSSSKQRVTILKGHTENVVDDLAFSRDGKRLASVGMSKTIRIWDVQAGTELMVLSGEHDSSITHLAMNSDGTRLCSTGYNGLVVLWDLTTGKKLVDFTTESENIYCATFIGDTGDVVLGGSDGMMRIVDAEKKEELVSLPAHEGILFDIAVAANGQFLATAGKDHVAKLWSLPRIEEVAVLKGIDEAVVGVGISTDSKMLYAKGGGQKNPVQIWSIPVEQLLRAGEAKGDAPK